MTKTFQLLINEKQPKRTNLNYKPQDEKWTIPFIISFFHEERLYHSVFLDNNLQSFRQTDYRTKNNLTKSFQTKYFPSLNVAWVLEGLGRNLILRRRKHEFINCPAKRSGLSLMIQKDNCQYRGKCY